MKNSNFHLNDHFSHFKQLFDNIHYFLGFPTSNFPNSFYECPFYHDYFFQVHLTRFTPQKHFLKITKKIETNTPLTTSVPKLTSDSIMHHVHYCTTAIPPIPIQLKIIITTLGVPVIITIMICL